jgi:DNA-binding transcriptional LysR family regulator
LRQYRHVLALADHASFRKASEALGISQPALTKSLFQIEREVGQRLFDRHGQRSERVATAYFAVYDPARRRAERTYAKYPRTRAKALARPARTPSRPPGSRPPTPLRHRSETP